MILTTKISEIKVNEGWLTQHDSFGKVVKVRQMVSVWVELWFKVSIFIRENFISEPLFMNFTIRSEIDGIPGLLIFQTFSTMGNLISILFLQQLNFEKSEKKYSSL